VLKQTSGSEFYELSYWIQVCRQVLKYNSRSEFHELSYWIQVCSKVLKYPTGQINCRCIFSKCCILPKLPHELMRFPQTSEAWKNRKKIPKNLTMTDSGVAPVSSANLYPAWKTKKHQLFDISTKRREWETTLDLFRARERQFYDNNYICLVTLVISTKLYLTQPNLS
jgi:hypothetical protein